MNRTILPIFVSLLVISLSLPTQAWTGYEGWNDVKCSDQCEKALIVGFVGLGTLILVGIGYYFIYRACGKMRNRQSLKV